MTSIGKPGASYLIRALLGVVFLLSATAKLVGIDSFETYVFGTGFFSLPSAFILSRLVITMEYALGALLILDIFPLAVTSLTVAVLTSFLVWAFVFRNLGDCHCFGDLIKFDFRQTVLKNIVMIALLAVSMRRQNNPWFTLNRKPVWITAAVLVPLACVFSFCPPDNWRYWGSREGEQGFNTDIFHQAVENGEIPSELLEGEQVICFFSVHCEFCRMSAERLAILRSRGEFSKAPATAFFGIVGDTPQSDGAVTEFFEATGFTPESFLYIGASTFLKVANSELPLIVVLENGEPAAVYHYRDLH